MKGDIHRQAQGIRRAPAGGEHEIDPSLCKGIESLLPGDRPAPPGTDAIGAAVPAASCSDPLVPGLKLMSLHVPDRLRAGFSRPSNAE